MGDIRLAWGVHSPLGLCPSEQFRDPPGARRGQGGDCPGMSLKARLENCGDDFSPAMGRTLSNLSPLT